MKQVLLLIASVLVAANVSADDIDQRCKSEWGSNKEMVEYCVKNQRNAKKEISAFSGQIGENCENEWGNNYEMVLYCLRGIDQHVAYVA
jgi:hypothetical protein